MSVLFWSETKSPIWCAVNGLVSTRYEVFLTNIICMTHIRINMTLLPVPSRLTKTTKGRTGTGIRKRRAKRDNIWNESGQWGHLILSFSRSFAYFLLLMALIGWHEVLSCVVNRSENEVMLETNDRSAYPGMCSFMRSLFVYWYFLFKPTIRHINWYLSFSISVAVVIASLM